VTCGEGQETATREILKQAEHHGHGCIATTEMTRPCSTASCGDADCEWADWEAWGSCTCDCDGGQRQRSRVVKRHATIGGTPCKPGATSEVQACNTQKCGGHCINGTWGDWEDWDACSQTCNGGIKWRHRAVAREANRCGHPAEGLSHMLASCNEDIKCSVNQDCEFLDWADWGACSDACHGIARRARKFRHESKGLGAHCSGALDMIVPCNPNGLGEKAPKACASIASMDCVQTDWTMWGKCSTSCGAGQTIRRRDISQPATLGGKPCESALRETEACNKGQCPQSCTKTDCAFSDWDAWSVCDKCGGEK